jgi:hypothetical protein
MLFGVGQNRVTLKLTSVKKKKKKKKAITLRLVLARLLEVDCVLFDVSDVKLIEELQC